MTPATVVLSSLGTESLYRDHHGWLVRWLRGRLGCAHQADDLAHDTFVRVLGKPAATAPDQPRAWLTTIAHGLMVDQARRRAIEKTCLDALAAAGGGQAPSPETIVMAVEALVAVDALLRDLPANVRRAFLLSRLEGLGHAQIAQRLGVTVSSVEKYMATAIRHCLAAREGA